MSVQAEPTIPSQAQAGRRGRSQVRPFRRVLLGALVTFLLVTSWSLVGALRGPGNDGVSVKLAEWARDHWLGPVVTAMETIQYKLHPPATGGSPDTSLLVAGASQPHRSHLGTVTGSGLAPIVPPVAPALPGEGVYVPVATAGGGQLVQVTYVRPDKTHTSYLAGVAWMSHRLRFVLHPGFQDPGVVSGLTQPDTIAPSQYSGLVATFNGGFKLADANGGYYDHGVTIGALRDGAASLVIYRDGHATAGAWGADVKMTPNVAFVRQNLQPLITNGAIASNVDANVQSNWGATIGGAYAVWRSGIGVTQAGDLVYAMGDAMSVSDLATILHRAGAVNAMQLDINSSWVSYMWYSHPGTGVTAHKLGQFLRPADRYLSDTSRDFIAVYAP